MIDLRGLPTRIQQVIWQRRVAAVPLGLRALQIALCVGRDFARGQLTLRAMGLVYTTLLSVVPLLALSFSVLKAFGVSNQIEPLLLKWLEPLGDKGLEVASNIVQFIARMNVGVLGAAGLVMLLYTAVSLLQKIEEAFNFIWHIGQSRRMGERFSRYLSVLFVGPILMFAAVGVTTATTNAEAIQGLLAVQGIGDAIRWGSRLTPYAIVIGTFTFMYAFIPNARVGVRAALVGGVVGGIAWQSAGWGFAAFIATSGQYSAVYSGLAILILFMLWLYLSWLVLLIGASVAFYTGHPEYLYRSSGEPRLSNRMRERVALSMMSKVATRFAHGQVPPTLTEFTRGVGVPAHSVRVVLLALERAHIVTSDAHDPPGYLPARAPECIALSDVVNVVRQAGERRYLGPSDLVAGEEVAAVIAVMEASQLEALQGKTLRDLVSPAPEAAPQDSAAPRPTKVIEDDMVDPEDPPESELLLKKS